MFDPRDVSADRFFVIAGPCVIESLEQCLHIGQHMRDVCQGLGLPYVFKASFDKANRSSNSSFRGPGIEDGLVVLREVKKQLSIPVLTDIHEPDHAEEAAEVVDVLQIPAFLARQTDLLHAAGHTKCAVNIKKGQFMSPQEMGFAADKVRAGGMASEAGGYGKASGGRISLTERGSFFGYNRLVNDFTGLSVMKQLGYPVVFDVTHSTQQPAGLGGASGGNPQYSPMLARSAIAAGVDGLFIECHPDPAKAKSDAATVLHLNQMEGLLKSCKAIANIRAEWYSQPPKI